LHLVFPRASKGLIVTIHDKENVEFAAIVTQLIHLEREIGSPYTQMFRTEYRETTLENASLSPFHGTALYKSTFTYLLLFFQANSTITRSAAQQCLAQQSTKSRPWNQSGKGLIQQ